MNKRPGVFAAALVAAAILIRGSNVSAPVQESGGGSRGVATTAQTLDIGPSAKDGPWLASCHYWAAVARADSTAEPNRQPARSTQNHVGLHFDGTLDRLNLNINGDDSGVDPGCGAGEKDRWGLPTANLNNLTVTSLIASVPDPVHTHMAMEFDRTIDTLLDAAADQGYLTTYFWMPWQRRSDTAASAATRPGQEQGHDPIREREPGLIVLKKVPPADDPNSYYNCIYLLLVGETPTQGVNGFQLQKALAYERDLKGYLAQAHYSRGKIFPEAPSSPIERARGDTSPIHLQDAVTLIGPTFSGSAASLRAGIDAAQKNSDRLRFELLGTTSTNIACKQILRSDKCQNEPDAPVRFHTFSGNGDGERLFLYVLANAGYGGHIAKLVEDDTVLGNAYSNPQVNPNPAVSIIRYPRDISLLRNAEVEPDSSPGSLPGSMPSPYLHFSAKDSGVQDQVPKFSTENTPLSQEAQLMTIARQMKSHKIRIALIEGSSTLDPIFLARFLRRADPDVQFVEINDLLMTRDLDNQPFIGALNTSPYNLIGIGSLERMRAMPNGQSKALYSAMSYAVWEATQAAELENLTPKGIQAQLQTSSQSDRAASATRASMKTLNDALRDGGYSSPLGQDKQPPLWATVIGRDGYYPIGVLAPCSSFSSAALPQVLPEGRFAPPDCNANPDNIRKSLQGLKKRVWVYPLLSWTAGTWLVILFCLLHAALIYSAEFGSSFTQDLVIEGSPEAHRRSLFLHVSTAALVLMAFTLALPAWILHRTVNVPGTTLLYATLLLLAALAAMVATFGKTLRQLKWRKPTGDNAFLGDLRTNFPVAGIALTWLVAILFGALWFYLCSSDQGDARPAGHAAYLKGLCFAYRCFFPASKVSPVVPVLLLLFAWYAWGFLQTRRLRFSASARPHLLQDPFNSIGIPYRVSDEQLGGGSQGKAGIDLYDRIQCPAFVWRIIRWHLGRLHQALPLRMSLFRRLAGKGSKRHAVQVASDAQAISPGETAPKRPKPQRAGTTNGQMSEWLVCVASILFFVLLALLRGPHSFDHFVWAWAPPGLPDLAAPFEFLVALLMFPLLWFSVSAWLRVIAIWSALKNSLLSRLEDQPIRFAFSRLQVTGWMTMLGRGSIRAQHRDMERCIESMRQMLHLPDLVLRLSPERLLRLQKRGDAIARNAEELQRLTPNPSQDPTAGVCVVREAIDLQLASFSHELLDALLVPYWRDQRIGFVEGRGANSPSDQSQETRETGPFELVGAAEPAAPPTGTPPSILAAEEFLAIRYMSVIRAVLSNLRYLMVFISLTFVLSIVAWNSYPFQQRQVVDLFFTSLLILIGLGMVAVFAQMHRDSILSRLSNTTPHELGGDFYFRVISFGAIPILTWLAYQFPEMANSVYKFLAPGASMFK